MVCACQVFPILFVCYETVGYSTKDQCWIICPFLSQDTLNKIKEIEATATQRETVQDEQSRAVLQKKEDKLQEEIDELRSRSSDMVTSRELICWHSFGILLNQVILLIK